VTFLPKIQRAWTSAKFPGNDFVQNQKKIHRVIHGVSKKLTNYSFDMPLPQLDVELLFKTVYEMSHLQNITSVQ